MEIQYVDMRERSWREMMALKATEEPRLIKERRIVIMQVRITAFWGTVSR
jgi:hypothetical protein